jgi:hypothetical protein
MPTGLASRPSERLEVTVMFPGLGLKKLAVKFAGLEKMD